MHTAETSLGTVTGPDLEPSELLPVIELDMDAIYQAAARTARRWRLEYDCDGAPFVAHVTAKSFACADLLARRDLADAHAAFTRFGARLVGSEQLS